jgi:hypothetical protein
MPGNDASGTGSTTRTRRGFLAGAAGVGAGAAVLGGPSVLDGVAQQGQRETSFTARIENVSDGMTLQPTDGSMQPVPLSPGAFAVHSSGEPMFSHGEPERMNGLEEIAEDGNPGPMVTTLADTDIVSTSGAFTTPVGASEPGPLTPGDAYEFSFRADRPAMYLSLVTMFVPSNDLFDGNDPVTGDVTEHVGLWDAGTEINEEPGVGENQVQRQRGTGVGLVERGTVAPIEEVNGYDYPAVADVIRVTLATG